MTEQKADLDLGRLIEGIRKHDESAVAELFEYYKNRVYYYALKITKNSADAEEVVQDTFIKIVKYIDQVKDATTFNAWIYKITASTALDLLRKNHKYTPVEEEGVLDSLVEPKDEPAMQTLRKDVIDTIKYEISVMPDDIALVASAKYLEEMSVAEIAEDLNLNPNTVKSRLRLFREKIQPILKSKGYDPSVFYSVTLLPVFATCFKAAMDQNTMSVQSSNDILHAVTAATVATGFAAKAVLGKLAVGALALGVVGGGGTYLVRQSMNPIRSIQYDESYTNTAIEVTVGVKSSASEKQSCSVTYGDMLLNATMEGSTLRFMAGENGDYVITCGADHKTVSIQNLDEVGPSITNITYVDHILSFQLSDGLSGVDLSRSYLQNGEEIISLQDLGMNPSLECYLGTTSYLHVFDGAGNESVATLNYQE